MRALIVDDEAVARDALRILLAQHLPEVVVIGEAPSASEAKDMLRRVGPDLVFLDVQMPGGDGFSLLRDLGTWDFDVVFVTGSDKHAIHAIRFSALDYLMKPVHPEELKAAVQRHRARSIPGGTDAQKHFLHNAAQRDGSTMRLTLTHGDRTHAIPPEDIAWCEADRNYTALHLLDERRFVSARTLKDYDELLSPLGFIRVHKNALVNRRHVANVDREGHVHLRNGVRVEISRRRLEEVTAALRD